MVILNEQLALHSMFLNIHQSDVLTVLFGCYMASTVWNCCCLSACSVYTIQPGNILQCHFMQNHKHWVHARFTVTSHPPFWQNDRDLLHDAVVTQGWNGHWNETQHIKQPWRRKFSHNSCQDLNLPPFNPRSCAPPLSYPRSQILCRWPS